MFASVRALILRYTGCQCMSDRRVHRVLGLPTTDVLQKRGEWRRIRSSLAGCYVANVALLAVYFRPSIDIQCSMWAQQLRVTNTAMIPTLLNVSVRHREVPYGYGREAAQRMTCVHHIKWSMKDNKSICTFCVRLITFEIQLLKRKKTPAATARGKGIG